MLSDPAQTGVVAVARAGGDAGERDARARGARCPTRSACSVDLVVANGLLPDRFDARGRPRAARPRRRRRPCARRSSRTSAPAAQRAQLARLRRASEAPVVTLPFVSAALLDAAAVEPLVARAGARGVRRRLEGRRVVICAGLGRRGQDDDLGRAGDGPRRGAGCASPSSRSTPRERLANSLGLDELDNEPRLVAPDRFAGHGIEMRRRAVGDDARRQADVRRARRAPGARTTRRATTSSPTGSTSSSRARSRARRSSPRWPSSTSSTAPGASTCSSSTRRRRATRSTSSTPPTGSRASSRAAR